MKKYLSLIAPISLFLIFIVFTILVKTVDVHYINYNNSYLGFYDLNYRFGNFATEFGKYESMDKISDVILYLSFGYTFVLLVFAVIEIIKLKSIKKMNKHWFILLGGYVAMVILYLIFEIAKVNYSPDSTLGNLKASYPSSHVFLGSVIFLINSYTALKLLKPEKEWIPTLVYAATGLICVLMVFTRSLACKHWLTDIIGSVLLVCFFISVFIYTSHKLVLEAPKEAKEE